MTSDPRKDVSCVPIPSVLDAEPGMGGVSGLSGLREQRPAQVPSSLL